MRGAEAKKLTDGLPTASEEDLRYFCARIEALAGVSLKTGKHNLVRARLRSRLVENGLDSFREYRAYLESLPGNHPEWEVFINMLTTNKTDFFREKEHFEILTKSIIPDFCRAGEKTFKVWTAASSTGEEAYTLAMVLDRALPSDRDFRILATDIDTNVLKAAGNAVYPTSRRGEIPVEYHQSGIDFGRREVKSWFRIKPRLKEKVIFKRHNLIEASAPSDNVFDLILCRNVMIYFDKKAIEFVARKLYNCAKPGGHLFIGHSESLQGTESRWTHVGPSIFRKESE